LYSATDARFHFIRAPRPELYDLDKDPRESHNLASDRPQTVGPMDAWLGRIRTAVSAPGAVDAQTRERLAALGYIGASAGVSASPAALADPKDKIGAYEELKKGLGLRAAGRDAEAVEQLRKVVADNPLMTDAWETLGLSLIALGRDQEGIAALDKALGLDPLRAEPHMALAKLYALEGKMTAAMGHAELASRTEPGKSFEILAQIMMDRKREGDAVAFARRSVAADPQRSMSLFILGTLARQHGRCGEALTSFQKAIAAAERAQGSVVRSLHSPAGDCLARLGREAEAEREFLAELRVLPRSVEGRVALATLYRSQNRDQEARTVLGGLVEGDPAPTADAYWAIVRTFTVLGDADAARGFAAQARARFPSDPRFR
jgi:tetratricopeptide (TPR) repeat protein